ncbi:MAG: glycosyltransferase family 87 protein [Candidatus Magasanikbacteria bacterium]
MFLKKLMANILNYRSFYIWILYLLGLAILVVEVAAFNISPLNFHHIYGEGLAGGGRDFTTFYFAGYRLRTVGEFYVVKNDNEFLPGEHERGISRFIYPPLLAFIFVPLSFFSLHTAFTWYSYLILIMFGVSIFLVTNFAVNKVLTRLVIGTLFLLSPIIWMHLAHGQTDILVLFCLALSFYFLTKNSSKSAGFFIGIAALLKLTPVIFIPYLFLKNKKAFFASLFTLIFGSVLLGVDRLLKFVDNLTLFSGSWATSSIFNNGLMGIFYNRLTRSIMSFSTSRSVYSILILFSVAFFFLALYRRIKINKTSTDEFFVLAEFAFFTSLMILIPSVSLIYNGVHLLFLLLIWWWLRERKIFSLKKQFFLDILIFLIFSEPLLVTWFQTMPGSLLFVFRPIYILIFLIIIFKEYSKKTYESRS